MKKRIYLDTCCYNRPFDERSNQRVIHESEAIKQIMLLAELESWTIVGSDMVRIEIDSILDDEKYEDVLTFYQNSVIMELSPDRWTYELAEKVHKTVGTAPEDSMHIALAEQNQVDYLLTTDDKMLHRALRYPLSVKMLNPIDFMKEVNRNDQQ